MPGVKFESVMYSNGKKLKLAFAYVASGQWTANLHYTRNVLGALRSLPDALRPEVVLVMPPGTLPAAWEALAPFIDGVLYHELVPGWEGRLRRRWTAFQRRLGMRVNRLGKFLVENGVDAVFGGLDFGRDFPLALVTWIADFQHVRLPEMFSPQELADRDARFHRLVDYADRVLLNSHDVLSDFARFDAAQRGKGRVVPFVSMVDDHVVAWDPRGVCGVYCLPERFIYIPNQFWKHKNHALVIKALGLARVTCPELTVVCSGNTNDYRNPGYFGSLLADVSKAGLRERMIMLGTVAHEDVFRLLRQSVAVLQPSLFEGWNTAIEECKSVGKAMIVSDIAVHREQNPPQTLYFPPGDEVALASCLCTAWREWGPGPDAGLEAEARQALPGRMKAFAEGFMSVIYEAMSVRYLVVGIRGCADPEK
jgi:glycosyltransferase involved in cell wall biosynthesis